jgi:hypothetical protein
MDRRSSIKTLLLLSAGTALLPSCLQEEKKASVTVKNFKINGNDEDIISALSDTIIPQGKTPGAKDVGAYQFALMMMDDCYSPEDQQKFMKGLKEFSDFSKKKIKKSFAKATPSERGEILKSIESKKDIPENVAFFYNNMKRLTLEAFTQSKYYLTQVHVYELVPGKFYGCVPVKKAS